MAKAPLRGSRSSHTPTLVIDEVTVSMTAKRNTSRRLKRVSAIAATTRRYVTTLTWLIRDLCRHHWSSIVVTLACGAAGVTAQASVLGLMLLYANKVVEDQSIIVLGNEFTARSPEALTLVAVTALVTLSIAAGLIFVSRTTAFRLGFRYETIATGRVLSSFGHDMPTRGGALDEIPGEMDVVRLAVADAAAVNRVTRILAEMPVAVFTFVGGAAIMIYMSFLLTLMIIPFALVAGAIMYRFNIEVAAAVFEFERETRASMSDIRHVQAYMRSLSGVNANDCDEVTRFVDSSRQGKRSRSKLRQLLAPQKSQLCINLLIAACVAMIVQYFGLRAFSGAPTEWGTLAGYLVALRFTLVSLRRIVTQVTKMSRFYSKLRRYYVFVRSGEFALGQPQPRLTLLDSSDTSAAKVELDAGDTFGLCTFSDVNRYTIYQVGERLAPCSSMTSSDWLASIRMAKMRSVSSPAPNHPSAAHTHQKSLVWRWPADAIRSLTGGDELNDWLVGQPGYEDWSKLGSPAIDEVSNELRFVHEVLSAAHSDIPVVVVDEDGLQALPPGVADALRSSLHTKLVAINYGREPGFGDHQEAACVCFLGDGSVVVTDSAGARDIWEQRRAALAAGGGLLDLDDESEDM